jgi:hypothetical protein
VKGLVLGITGALKEAREADPEAHVEPPEDLVISGLFVTDLSEAELVETTTTPAHTVNTTETTPAHTVTTTDQIGAVTESATSTPPNRTTTRQETGGDVQETDIEHENF